MQIQKGKAGVARAVALIRPIIRPFPLLEFCTQSASSSRLQPERNPYNKETCPPKLPFLTFASPTDMMQY
jgi:hypothetical protein